MFENLLELFGKEVYDSDKGWENARQIITKLAKRGDDLDEIHGRKSGSGGDLKTSRLSQQLVRWSERIMYPILIVLLIYMRSVSIA